MRLDDSSEAVGMSGRSRLCLSCSLSVVVEDVSSSACVTVKVFPYMTVAALKQQVRGNLSQEANDGGGGAQVFLR